MFRRAPRSIGLVSSSTLVLRAVLRKSSHSAPNALPARTTDTPALFKKIKNHVSLVHFANGGSPSDTEVDIFNKTVNKLQKTLQQNDLRASWTHWSLLERQKLLRFLGPDQLENFSRLIARLCFSDDSDKSRDEIEMQAIEEIALAMAAGRATDALNACMLSHIRRGNPETVLELNRRFLELVERNGNWERNESTEGSAEVEEANYDAFALAQIAERDERYNPGRVSILLAVTTAHAMKDSFEGALQASLTTNLRFPHFTVSKFLKQLSHDTLLRQKVEDYVRRLDIARLVVRSPSFVKHVTNLSKDQAVRQLEKLYNAVLDGLSGPNAYLAAHPGAIDSSKPVLVSELAWTSFLSAFLRCQRTDLAEKLWDDMLKLGIHTGASLWTALFDGYDSMGAVKDVVNGWDTMLSAGVTPDALTHRALISTLFNGKEPDKALKRFKIFEDLKPSSLWDPVHILSVYNTALHGLLLNMREKEAAALLQAMKDKGPKPDIVSYNTILRYYGRRGDFKTLAAHVRELTSDGLVGDVFTFSTILSALLKVGREDAPEMMVNLMEKQGVKPNVATFSAVIDQQMREQDEKNLHAALRLLQQMEQNPQTQPNEVTYTTVLAGMYRGQWLDPRVAEEHRQDIVQRMKSRGIQPNRLTYQILLKACLKYPEPDGLQSALHYYREMVQRRISMPHETWYILLHGLMDRGEWAIANEMIRDMTRKGCQPVGALANLVSTIRRRMNQKILGPSEYL